jgi:hypothetical protein
MTDLPSSTVCPFDALLDKRILGEFTAEDRSRLEEHLASGCPQCTERAKQEGKLETLIDGAVAPLAQEAERRKRPFLDKLEDRLEREDDFRRQRRRRRIGMNAVLFLIMILGVALLSAEYFAYAAMRKKLLRAQRAATETEVKAILLAVHKLAEERGAAAVPADRSALLTALAQRRRDIDRPYYSPDPSRIEPSAGLLLDTWGRPYVYKRTGDQVRLYSLGQNGADEDGLGDDIAIELILPR